MSLQRRRCRERVLANLPSRWVRPALLALVWAAASCGSPTDGPPAVSRVVVTAPVSELIIGQTTRLEARLEDASGNALTGRGINWTSSNNTFATVSTAGVVTARAAGPVTITATSEGRSGSAALTIFADPCLDSEPIAVNEPVTGELTSQDCRLQDESLADRWLLILASPTPVQIDLASEEFNAFLILTTTNNDIIAFDDNGAGNFNARLDTTLAAGTYVVWANAFSAGQSGDYSLAVASTATSHCAIVGSIAVGQTVSQSLSTTDCLLGDGTYADAWELNLTAPTGLRAALNSEDFDAFVVVTDAQGNRIAYNDDSPLSTNSLLRLTLDAGSYRVWANSFYPSQTGDYTLSLERDACNSSVPLALGATATGELTADDCELSDGSLTDRWLLTLGSPGTVRLDLSSDAFDPYLLVTDALGEVLATDDDSGTDSDARIEATLSAGTYVVWTNTYAAGQTGAYSLSAATVAPAALNLRVDGLYVTQATQRFSGTVPLVKNRNAYLRVFGRANLQNTAAPTVRVRVYNGAVVIQTLTLPATVTSVPTSLSEGNAALSWNVTIDAANVQPGLAIDAEIDPTGSVAESDETDNSYPASGTPRPFDVREAPPLNLTFVPVRQSVNGLVGNVTAANTSTYLAMAREVYPLETIDVAVRDVYTTTLPALEAQDDNRSWPQLLGEINALRIADNSDRAYYGVVKVNYPTGVGGIGYIGQPTAIGVDAPGARSFITAHELGHNFGRFHSPCGGPGALDPNYPYENAAIGVFGYDRTTNRIVARTTPDLMGYCANPWVSDYTYEGVLAFRQSAAAALGIEAARPVLLVWGSVDQGRVSLEPAFHIIARPSMPRKAGPWTLVARDADNRVLFSHSFDVTPVGDAERPAAAFAFALPADSLLAARIHSLRVTGPAGEARVGLDAGAARPPRGGNIPARAQRTGDRVTMTWDRNDFPAALLRDSRTGRILSIVRNGQLTTRLAPGLELLLSDGVRTTRQRVEER